MFGTKSETGAVSEQIQPKNLEKIEGGIGGSFKELTIQNLVILSGIHIKCFWRKNLVSGILIEDLKLRVGRPKNKWRRILEKECKFRDKSWRELRHILALASI